MSSPSLGAYAKESWREAIGPGSCKSFSFIGENLGALPGTSIILSGDRPAGTEGLLSQDHKASHPTFSSFSLIFLPVSQILRPGVAQGLGCIDNTSQPWPPQVSMHIAR